MNKKKKPKLKKPTLRVLLQADLARLRGGAPPGQVCVSPINTVCDPVCTPIKKNNNQQ